MLPLSWKGCAILVFSHCWTVKQNSNGNSVAWCRANLFCQEISAEVSSDLNIEADEQCLLWYQDDADKEWTVEVGVKLGFQPWQPFSRLLVHYISDIFFSSFFKMLFKGGWKLVSKRKDTRLTSIEILSRVNYFLIWISQFVVKNWMEINFVF